MYSIFKRFDPIKIILLTLIIEILKIEIENVQKQLKTCQNIMNH